MARALWCVSGGGLQRLEPDVTLVLFAGKMQAEASIVDPLVPQGLRHRADSGYSVRL